MPNCVKIKKLLFNFIVTAITLLLLFIFFETYTRVAIYFKDRKSLEKAIQSLPGLKKGQNATLREIIQPSKYPKVIYELRPNISVYFQNVLVETNNQGLRSKEILIKEKNTIRIICLGDSFMFGYRVGQDETVPIFLEKELNAKFPQKRWEIINTAVPGYNTTMEIESLEKKFLIYKPDIVIMEHIGNDFNLPNFIYETEDILNIKIFFVEFLLRRYKLAKERFKLLDAPKNSRQPWRFEDDPKFVPEQYKDMVGWEGFVRAMIKLQKLQEKNDFDVIFFETNSRLNIEVHDFCRQLGFHAFFNFLNANNPMLVVSTSDNHPTALQNKKTSENILNYLMAEGIIQRYLGKNVN